MKFNAMGISREVISNLNYCKKNLLELYEIINSKYNAKYANNAKDNNYLLKCYGYRITKIQEIKKLIEEDLQWFDKKITEMQEAERKNIELIESINASLYISDTSAKQELSYNEEEIKLSNSEYLKKYIEKYGELPQDLDSIPIMFFDEEEKKLYINENASDVIIQGIEENMNLCSQKEFFDKYIEMYGELPQDLDSIPVKIYDEKNGKLYINENTSGNVINKIINNFINMLINDDNNFNIEQSENSGELENVSLENGENVSLGGESQESNSTDVSMEEGNNTTLGGENLDKELADVDDIDKNENPNLNDEIVETQITEVMALIYGAEISISDEEREMVIESIKDINKTSLLEGIDINIANNIVAKIIQDYLDGKLELEGITKEELQEYIESQPSIKVEFEIDKALKSFESLIESEVLTEEQIKTIIDEKINIYSTDEEFMEVYINLGGTETDISNIESFFDIKTNEIHIRDTVDSKVIINSIICIIGEDLLLDEEIGQVFNPSNTEGENSEGDVVTDVDSKIDIANESSKDS